jgi:hypothetical protein
MSDHASEARLHLPLAGPMTPARRTSAAAAKRQPAVAALETRPGEPLGEDAFRELLAIERARAGRAGRTVRLLRVSLKPANGQAADIKQALATRMFAGLTEALRDTDIVGWHREGRVAGAVLVDGAAVLAPDAGALVVKRVRDVLHERLPSTVASRLQLRVVRIRQT